MGIQPPSDIVLDVMQAADPRKAQTVAANLQKLSAGASSGVFDSMVSGVNAGYQASLAYTSNTAVGLRNMTAMARNPQAGADTVASDAAASIAKDSPYRKFEAMVLSTFVESMLPSNASAVYGSGNAGGIWRTMLAQKIGDQVAQAGGIGIASRIASKQAELTAAASGTDISGAPSQPMAAAGTADTDPSLPDTGI